MIGSMIVGFLIGLIASAISNRGEHMGCIGKTFVGWLGAFVGQLLFGNWGQINSYIVLPVASFISSITVSISALSFSENTNS